MLWVLPVTPSRKKQLQDSRTSRDLCSVAAEGLRKVGSIVKVKSSTRIHVFGDVTPVYLVANSVALKR